MARLIIIVVQIVLQITINKGGKMNKQRINNIGDKVSALTYLYKDWLHYKKYYKSIGFPMKETFIEYLKREIDVESIGGNEK